MAIRERTRTNRRGIKITWLADYYDEHGIRHRKTFDTKIAADDWLAIVRTRRWVIWSEEHGRWWAPGRSGYVDQLADAGRYSATDAIEIERSGNYPTRPPEFREIAIPDPLPAFQRSRVQEFADADFRLRNRQKT